jgi:hypothetical protein
MNERKKEIHRILVSAESVTLGRELEFKRQLHFRTIPVKAAS